MKANKENDRAHETEKIPRPQIKCTISEVNYRNTENESLHTITPKGQVVKILKAYQVGEWEGCKHYRPDREVTEYRNDFIERKCAEWV